MSDVNEKCGCGECSINDEIILLQNKISDAANKYQNEIPQVLKGNKSAGTRARAVLSELIGLQKQMRITILKITKRVRKTA